MSLKDDGDPEAAVVTILKRHGEQRAWSLNILPSIPHSLSA